MINFILKQKSISSIFFFISILINDIYSHNHFLKKRLIKHEPNPKTLQT
jgi:hypothetical protein